MDVGWHLGAGNLTWDFCRATSALSHYAISPTLQQPFHPVCVVLPGCYMSCVSIHLTVCSPSGCLPRLPPGSPLCAQVPEAPADWRASPRGTQPVWGSECEETAGALGALPVAYSSLFYITSGVLRMGAGSAVPLGPQSKVKAIVMSCRSKDSRFDLARNLLWVSR